MADDLTFVNTATGAIPNGTVVNTRDTGSGHAQKVDVAPWKRTIKTPGQYALSVTTGASVTLTWPSGATHALVSVDPGGGDIRWRPDATAPTSANGHRVQAGDAFEIDNLGASFAMIGAGSNATVQVTYYGYD